MKETRKTTSLLMVGPDIEGLGGISRVVRLWRTGGYFLRFGIEYFPSVPAGEKRVWPLIRALLLFLPACAGGCRAVYVHTASFNSFYRKCLFMIPALLFGRRLIVHVHPAYFTRFLRERGGVRRMVAREVLSRAAAFVVLTPEIGADLSALFPGRPVHVLNNPVDIRAMRDGGCATRRPGHVLFLGWYMKRKGVYELVDALRMLLEEGHEVGADFFGTKETSELAEYVSGLGLGDKIRINGWIGEEDKLDALHGCEMLVLPSHTEGIPNVILEAMATRTPIVSTLVGGLKEVLRDGENALIAEPENARDLSRKILAVMRDREQALARAENAYQQACERYDLPVIEKRLEEILDAAAPLPKPFREEPATC